MTAVSPSSRRMFDILDFVGRAAAPVGVAEVSLRLGMPVSSAHRALASLERSGMIAADGNSSRYVLGPLTRRLFLSFFGGFPVRNAAMPHLRRLATATGQTASLWVRLGWHVVRIAAIEGASAVVDRAPLGVVMPMDVSRSGLVIVATLPAADLDRLAAFAARHWRRRPEGLATRAEAIRRRGFATGADVESGRPPAVVFAIGGVDEPAFASLAIEGPAATVPSESWLELVREFRDQVAAQPRLRFSPFGHLDPDGVILPLETIWRPGGEIPRGDVEPVTRPGQFPSL